MHRCVDLVTGMDVALKVKKLQPFVFELVIYLCTDIEERQNCWAIWFIRTEHFAPIAHGSWPLTLGRRIAVHNLSAR